MIERIATIGTINRMAMFRVRSFNNQSRDHRPTPDPPSSSPSTGAGGGLRCPDFIVMNRPTRPAALWNQLRSDYYDCHCSEHNESRITANTCPVTLSCDATVLTPTEKVLTVSCRPDIWIMRSLAGHARQPHRRHGNGRFVSLTHVCRTLAKMDPFSGTRANSCRDLICLVKTRPWLVALAESSDGRRGKAILLWQGE